MGFIKVVILLALAVVTLGLTPSSFLSQPDKARLEEVFTAGLKKEDVSSLHYSVQGLTVLGKSVPNAPEVCKKLQAKMEGSLSNIYLAATAGATLKCSGLKASADAAKLISNGLSSDTSGADLYYSVLAQSSLGGKIDSATVLKNVQAILKKDDSIVNLGYAFHIAEAVGGSDIKAIFSRIEDAVVQADEIDGKMLQFEGGLSVTDTVLSGAYKLSSKVGQAPAISKMQSVKFANYFLSRKSVQAVKGAYHLLNALTTLTTNKYHIPVAITLGEQSAVVSESSPKVTVRITDLLGNSLGKMDVTVDSAMRKSDGAVVISKGKMSAVGSDGIAYDIDVMKTKPGRGFYELTISAVPSKADSRLVGNSEALLVVKALGSVVVSEASIGIADADQSTAPKMKDVAHPKTLDKILDADHHHKIVFKFALKDKVSSEKIRVHQAFVMFRQAKSGAEIIFLAEPDSNSVYKFELDVSAKDKDFGGLSGKYEIHLIVGDAVISNPVSWHLADVNLKFPADGGDAPAPAQKADTVKPEIKHLFREPEKRPPAMVSNLFTLLCLAPALIMFIGWLRVGVNISGFPFSITAIGFHVGLGAIFTLYYYFWLQLDMFATMKYLLMVGVVTFLCGNSMLVRIATRRKQSQ